MGWDINYVLPQTEIAFSLLFTRSIPHNEYKYMEIQRETQPTFF